MIFKNAFIFGFTVLLLLSAFAAVAQIPGDLNRFQQNGDDTSGIGYDTHGNPVRKQTGNDSLQHRDAFEDSITIHFRFFDSTKVRRIDSSINDFYTRFPVPYYNVDLGNTGTPTRSLIFSPYMKPGFDAGFHAYDAYRYTVENSRFFQTTRPYTELGYLLGSKSEQIINILHTQNRKSNFNLTFEYRFINVPGSFKNQNSSHNNIRFNTFFQTNNKRYGNYFIFISNKLRSSENGGLQDKNDLTGTSFSDPFRIETRLGTNTSPIRNFFQTAINTGTLYDENILLFRQYYDFGQKDSLVTDSVTYKLFYPRIRFQHTVKYSKNTYAFQDAAPIDSLYLQYYNYTVQDNAVSFKDQWQNLTNDFSIISFPEKNNLNQFLKLSAGYEMISGGYYPYKKDFNNLYAGGEYRNRTRNQKWDVEATAQFYVTGSYAGDYSAFLSLKRELNKKLGSLELGVQNVNRSPSYIFNQTTSGFPVALTSFPVIPGGNFNKENILKAFANIDVPSINLQLTGEYYIISNYTYFDNFYNAKQESTLFNVLHIGAEKKFKLSRHWNWYSELHVQQTTGNPPVNLPFILTRNRIAFEGNFYKNLFISTGFEIRYYTAYKADNYMPLNGQFFFQDNETISNRPDVNAFLQFRIRSFKGFIRLENLNTINPSNGFKFTANNFSAPNYATQALWLHVGIWWSFVN